MLMMEGGDSFGWGKGQGGLPGLGILPFGGAFFVFGRAENRQNAFKRQPNRQQIK
ncbi:MAG: hypothetical protein IPN20_12440 [Haliscomenobacter sp.]|nr:hypothetical protein [Haliscomenobacter sp.]